MNGFDSLGDSDFYPSTPLLDPSRNQSVRNSFHSIPGKGGPSRPLKGLGTGTVKPPAEPSTPIMRKSLRKAPTKR